MSPFEESLSLVKKRAGAVLADTPRQSDDGRTAELREMAELAFVLAHRWLQDHRAQVRSMDVFVAKLDTP